MIRMLVADGNDTMRLGIRSVLNEHGRCMVIDEVSSTTELFMRLRARDYELVMVEPMLCGETGPRFITQLREIAPQTNILVFTALDEKSYGLRVIRNGAKGFLMKTCSADELVTAVDRVGQGKIHISTALAEEFAVALSREANQTLHASLSHRELETFSMLACGRTITEIANGLQLSVKTVSTHKARTMAKLQISSLSELVRYAVSQGMMEDCHAICSTVSSRHHEP
jgi:DNA-binding NarL/FixJ family response regulator